MPTKKVKEALEAFEVLDGAQTRWEEAMSELSDKEEAQLEKLLLSRGVIIEKHEQNTETTSKKAHVLGAESPNYAIGNCNKGSQDNSVSPRKEEVDPELKNGIVKAMMKLHDEENTPP